MFDPEIMAVVAQGTADLAQSLKGKVTPATPLPDLLYYPTDAAGILDIVRHRALSAPYSSAIDLVDIFAYGFTSVQRFVGSHLASTRGDPPRRAFAEAVLKHLHPGSEMFAGFYVRFTESADRFASARARRHPGYALGLETRDMGVRVGGSTSPACMSIAPAIYSLQRQSWILETLYGAYETYYLNALRRFGDQHAASCLGQCWSMFYESVAEPLLLFRDPALSPDREWLATALDPRPPAAHDNDNIDVAIQGNAFIPYVRVLMPARPGKPSPGLPIREIVLSDGLEPEHLPGLRSLLQLKGLATVSVRVDGLG